MNICVDFDGTIVDHRFPAIGPVVPGAIDWMKKWQQLGAKLFLFTMRSDRVDGAYLTDAVNLLKANGIELHGANENLDQKKWTGSPKLYASIYVDDAAYGCPLYRPYGFERKCVNWNIVGPGVEKALLDKYWTAGK